MKKSLVLLSCAMLLAFVNACSREEASKYGPGVSDTEIKLGNTMPYSGPASAIGALGRTISAYFEKVNENGGINGRQVRLISLDDSYTPPKTVEQMRKLVEQEEVAAIVAPLGTPTNVAVRDYLNQQQVPHLFLISAASFWNDPEQYPWSMSMTWGPNYQSEGFIQARYVLNNNPDARVAVIYQNDDGGKDLLSGLKAGLGDKVDTVLVAEASYEVTDPTIDSQVISLHASGADTLFIYAITPKACSQTIRKVYNLGWRPMRFLFSGCVHPKAVLEPAGLTASKGLLSLRALKTVAEETQDDPIVQEYLAFMAKYYPEGAPEDGYSIYGYMIAHAIAEVITRAGDNLTRENIMKQATSLTDVSLPMLMPGILINTSPTDYATIQDAYMMKFDGEGWRLIGDLLRGN
ncbi:MAG: ABC transporter substrate-binding protein [Betaproteobacteria bacterium]|nr:MAG: ABC transporter substrate-binding protein [Betaproteobacteria bacterium]